MLRRVPFRVAWAGGCTGCLRQQHRADRDRRSSVVCGATVRPADGRCADRTARDLATSGPGRVARHRCVSVARVACSSRASSRAACPQALQEEEKRRREDEGGLQRIAQVIDHLPLPFSWQVGSRCCTPPPQLAEQAVQLLRRH